MKSITFLGPLGATFSHDAYTSLAEIYGTPNTNSTNYVPASSNAEVLRLIEAHGGYGAIAMETLAEGRVDEPFESFIHLLDTHSSIDTCPIRIAAAIRLKLHFCLMTRSDISTNDITGVIAHPKALGACKNRIAGMKLPTISTSSNGEAARLVAQTEEYRNYAALAPQSAAEKYGLKIHSPCFEDDEAITTFFLITPDSHQVSVGKENRVLIVFKVPHSPGALVKSLVPFHEEGLNLILIHSIHCGNGTYNFAIEIEAREDELGSLDRAMKKFNDHVQTYLSFGPFEVISK